MEMRKRMLTLLTGSLPIVNGTTKRLIEHGPIILRCAPTMVEQWIHELHVWFRPRAVDILEYTTLTRKEFWDDDGIYNTSKQPSYRKIIVASHMVSVPWFCAS